jgi:uncharacterized protein YdhG (YjbR/CyaY superfamily)
MIPGVPTMDEYLDGLPAPQRAALERVRAVVTKLAPEAEEGVSYGMPAPEKVLADIVRARQQEITTSQ